MTSEKQLVPKPAAPGSDATPARFGVLQRKCACGGAAGKEGECEECRQKAMNLQRRANNGAGAAPPAVPPIVHDVLRSPGQPLDASTRAYMEPRFGHDFSKVRVHADDRAAESAKAVNALAYTVGRDIVFGAAQYAPGRPNGDRLLRHELTHVIQQNSRRWTGEALIVEKPDAVSEREAESLASETGRSIPAGESRLAVARQGFAAEPAMEPAPLPPPAFRPPPVGRPAPGAGPTEAEGKGEDVKTPDARQYPSPYDTSFEPMWERARREPDEESLKEDLETPIATLAPGGSPPTFVTPGETKTANLATANRYNLRIVYQEHHFHILDAIDYRVGRANNEAELQAVLNDLVLGPPNPGLLRPRWVIWPQFDPASAFRMQIYLNAVARRKSALPGLDVGTAAGRSIPAETRRRGCRWTPKPPAGDIFGQAPSIYCQNATGSPFEYEVVTPRGLRSQFDALVGADIVIECKCGYETIADALAGPDNERRSVAELRMDAIDKQMARHAAVAQECGLRLAYVVSNQKFRDLLQTRWFGNVPVVHKPWKDVCGKP